VLGEEQSDFKHGWAIRSWKNVDQRKRIMTVVHLERHEPIFARRHLTRQGKSAKRRLDPRA
jgi:hypothetical protein